MTKLLTQGAFAVLIGAGALMAATTSASAAIVCNRDGECWHTHDRYAYPAGFGVVIHDDNWRWGHHDHYPGASVKAAAIGATVSG
jgi:hypothetical protein